MAAWLSQRSRAVMCWESFLLAVRDVLSGPRVPRLACLTRCSRVIRRAVPGQLDLTASLAQQIHGAAGRRLAGFAGSSMARRRFQNR